MASQRSAYSENPDESTRPLAFFDTNSIHSNSFDYIFGSREELLDISKLATILVPEMVISELVEQRRRQFESDYRQLCQNGTVKYLCNHLEGFQIPDPDFSPIEKTLLNDRSIPYVAISLTDYEAAHNEISTLALHQASPFDRSGAGYKDAIIAVTIMQYLMSEPHSEELFLVSADKQLISYFDSYHAIVICQTVKDLLEKLQAGKAVDQCSQRATNNEKQKEYDRELIEGAIGEIENCRSFVSAHSLVAKLGDMKDAFLEDDEMRLLQASFSNDQIYQILYDPDLLDFFVPLFEKHENSLSESQRHAFLNYAKLELIVLENGEKAIFTREEILRYRAFSNELDDHVALIDEKAVIVTNVQTIHDGLRKVLADCGLEEDVPDAKQVIRVFVNGAFRYRRHLMKVATLKEFVSLFEDSSRAKRTAIVENIATMLDASKDYAHQYYSADDDDIPF